MNRAVQQISYKDHTIKYTTTEQSPGAPLLINNHELQRTIAAAQAQRSKLIR